MERTGFVSKPMLHVFMEDLEQPYVGFVNTREFYRGDDAKAAVTRLGLLPSALAATRVLIMWENADLLTAIEQPGKSFAPAMVSVEATFTTHTLTWHPYTFTIGPPSPEFGTPTVIPQWQEPQQHPNAALPECIADAIDMWREIRQDDIDLTTQFLQREGFGVNFVRRT